MRAILQRTLLIGTMSLAALTFLADTAQAARRAGGKQVIVQDASGRYHRGFAEVNGSIVTVTDPDGKSAEYDRKDNSIRIYEIAELQREFEKDVRDAKSDDEDEGKGSTGDFVRLLARAKDMQLYEEVQKLAEKIMRRNSKTPNPQAVDAAKWAKEQLERFRNPVSAADAFLLSAEDMNKVRFALAMDTPEAEDLPDVRLRFQGDVLKRFFDQMKADGKMSDTDIAAFRKLKPAQQLAWIKKLTGDSYAKDVQVLNDPPLITEFRKTVVPMLNRSCAMPACHGDMKQKFHLPHPMRTPEEIYTAFVVLEQYPAKSGPIINHSTPNRSLLLTCGLPQDKVEAGLKHPNVIPTLFTDEAASNAQSLLAWLKTVPAAKPEYGVKLPQVGSGAETAKSSLSKSSVNATAIDSKSSSDDDSKSARKRKSRSKDKDDDDDDKDKD